MNFIITHNNQIVLGPRRWNRSIFESELADLGSTTILPPNNTDFISISDSIKIYPVSIVSTPAYNTKIEQLSGPFYTFAENSAIAKYEIVPKAIDVVKNELKGLIATARYKKEIAGTTTTIQGVSVNIDTSRTNRNIYAQQYSLMAAADTVQWKFAQTWLTLTKADLKTCALASSNYVQLQFAWESTKILEIDACTTLAELDLINLN